MLNRIRRWIIFLMGFTFLMVYGAGIVRLLHSWQPLGLIPMVVSREYLLLKCLIWGGLGLALVLGRLLRATWSTPIVQWGGWAYLAWFWLDRMVIAVSDGTDGNFFLWLVLTPFLAALFWWVARKNPYIQNVNMEPPNNLGKPTGI